jgi:hypothetical protein
MPAHCVRVPKSQLPFHHSFLGRSGSRTSARAALILPLSSPAAGVGLVPTWPAPPPTRPERRLAAGFGRANPAGGLNRAGRWTISTGQPERGIHAASAYE